MSSTYGYCTYTDLDDDIIGIAGLLPSGETAPTWFDKFINKAEKEINARLAARYVVPFTGVIPPGVSWLGAQLACYEILRANFSQEGDNENTWAQSYRDEADKFFLGIEEGRISLGDPVVDAGANANPQSSTSGYARVFSCGVTDTSGNTVSSGSLDGV